MRTGSGGWLKQRRGRSEEGRVAEEVRGQRGGGAGGGGGGGAWEQPTGMREWRG